MPMTTSDWITVVLDVFLIGFILGIMAVANAPSDRPPWR
jgi:hypothetical protein